MHTGMYRRPNDAANVTGRTDLLSLRYCFADLNVDDAGHVVVLRIELFSARRTVESPDQWSSVLYSTKRRTCERLIESRKYHAAGGNRNKHSF